ncbi:Alpha/Beta hydrolase protein [Panaeolus papilionaceus]|nr:Alpha/Beta hydrolase protein [Panaeolus papilionaceus]
MASSDSHYPIVVKTVVSSIDGTKIYAEAIGDPTLPAIVYIHGNSLCGDVFDYQFFDKKLQSAFYQVRFDLRGHGRSETPSIDLETPRFDDAQQASDVAAVLEAFSITKPIFVGWSYGAVIPTDYMTVYGVDNIRGLAIVNGVAGEWCDILPFFTSGPYPCFTDNEDATGMHNAYGKWIEDLSYKSLRGMLTEAHTDTRQWIFKRDKKWDAYLQQATISIPQLILFGRHDKINSIAFMDFIAKKCHSELLTLKVIEDAGHSPLLEKPEEFNSILYDWASSIVKKA